nr:integrase, catalytic region, zinc finger, CCHC-type, peptidase aspartic, catalytic [Tanacetum cinerariifolium]
MDLPNTILHSNRTVDELTATEAKQVEADDQAIQTILIGLPDYIYAINGDNVVQNVRNKVGHNAVQSLGIQNVGNQNGLIVVPGIANRNRNGSFVAIQAENNGNGNNANQISCYNYRGVGHHARNYTVRLRRRDQAFTSGTHADKAPVYNSDGSAKVIEICLWCVDSGCSKHMTENLKLFINFIWKFLGTVCFGNDHVAAILGYGNLQWGNILITWVYLVEVLGHNLFSVGQFCDLDLEIAFRMNTFFVNLDGVDLLKGNRSTNLYIINLYEMTSAFLICLMAHATSTKSWLWHQRLSHLNFDTINTLAKDNLVTGLPKFKYTKDHLCPFCEQGKSKKSPHKPKPNDREDIEKLGTKGDIGFFSGYSSTYCAYRVYNRRIKKVMETMNVTFDELSAMAFEQRSLKPKLQGMTSGHISSGLDLTYASLIITSQKTTERDLELLFEEMYGDYMGGQLSDASRTDPTAPATLNLHTPVASTKTIETGLA